MAIEKYGVEDRKALLEQELEEVRSKLADKTATNKDHLIERELALIESIDGLAEK